MELSKLRESGELSDIQVVVSGEAYDLHKFPLFIKSNYFKELAEGNASTNKIEMDDFPGGKSAFNIVADFCYNKHVNITLDNVVVLRCAAEYMQMHGSGNLIELTDRYLNDILTSARLSRSLMPVIDLLAQCSELGEIAEKAEVADKCFKAVVDIWMKPSSLFSATRKGDLYGEDTLITDKLVQISLDWFIKLINTCKSNETKLKPLADLVCKYLERVFQCEAAQEDEEEKVEEEGEKEQSKPDGEENGETAGSDAEADEKELTAIENEKNERSTLPKLKECAGKILDSVVNELPENTPLAEVISVEWIRRAIEVSEKYDCQCRERLLQLAGNILHRFTNEELKEIPSAVLCDIIENTIRNEKIVPEVLTCVLDNYLHDLARKGDLNVDDFVKLVKSVPDDYRSSHDTLFEVMEQLLSSGEDIPDEKKIEMLATVDLSRCHEKTLQRALDKGTVPVKEVCQAAITLATKLRGEADQAARQKKQGHYPTDSDHRKYDKSYGSTMPLQSSQPYSYYNSYETANEHQDYHSSLTYPSNYSSSIPLRSRVRADDYSSSALDDSLRTELNRISSSYDHYFRERNNRSNRDPITSRYSSYKGSTRRW